MNCNSILNSIIKTDHLILGNLITKYNFIYIIVASLIGGIGLLYNSITFIISAMIISPIGEPVLKIISAILLKNNSLLFTNFLSLLFKIGLSYSIGLVLGYINSKIDYFKTPTNEMKNRTNEKYILADVVIALLIGFITIIALKYKNMSILLAISIATTILVPIVNSGLYHGIYLDKGNYNDIKNGINSLNLGLIYIIFIILSSFLTLLSICK